MSKLRPLNQNVVVQPVESEQRTPSGIYIPDSAKQRPEKGTVIAVGPGRLLDNGQRATMEVGIGDLVYFSRYGGNEVTIEGVDYLIIAEEQIQCVLEGAAQEAVA
jgi:chaperonin GroES